jgi:hypothetical protein
LSDDCLNEKSLHREANHAQDIEEVSEVRAIGPHDDYVDGEDHDQHGSDQHFCGLGGYVGLKDWVRETYHNNLN